MLRWKFAFMSDFANNLMLFWSNLQLVFYLNMHNICTWQCYLLGPSFSTLYNLVLQILVLHFPVMTSGPSFSSPVFAAVLLLLVLHFPFMLFFLKYDHPATLDGTKPSSWTGNVWLSCLLLVVIWCTALLLWWKSWCNQWVVDGFQSSGCVVTENSRISGSCRRFFRTWLHDEPWALLSLSDLKHHSLLLQTTSPIFEKFRGSLIFWDILSRPWNLRGNAVLEDFIG